MEILFFILILCLYFLPALIASHRRHPNRTPIMIINFGFGWTLLGWFACLAWAYSGVNKND